MKKKHRSYGWFIGIACVVVVGGWGYSRLRSARSKNTITSAAQYLVNRAQQGTFTGEVSGAGTVQAQTTATIQATADGSIVTLPVALGQAVAEGAPIATLSGGQVITSPMSGTVVSISVVSGAYVSAGETVVTVADLATTYADVEIPEESIRSVASGQTAVVTVPALPNQTFTGTVTQVGLQGSSSGGVVEFPVLIKISNPKGLLLGMSANANITTGVRSAAIWVPTAAVQVVNGVTVVTEPKSPLSLGFAGYGGTLGHEAGFSGGSGNSNFGAGYSGGSGGSGPYGGAGARARGAAGTQQTIPVEVPVTIGLTNSTSTQILSGVRTGQQVLIPNPAASSTSNGGGSRFSHGFGGVGL